MIGALGRDGAAVELARQPDGEVANIDHLLDLANALRCDLPRLERHKPGEIILGGAHPLARANVRMMTKMVDEYVHVACMTLTFATANREFLARMTPQEMEAELAKSPDRKRAEIKRQVIITGDPEKAESAAIFYEYWKKAASEKRYAAQKRAWKGSIG